MKSTTAERIDKCEAVHFKDRAARMLAAEKKERALTLLRNRIMSMRFRLYCRLLECGTPAAQAREFAYANGDVWL